MVNYWYFYLKQLSKMSVCETCVARRSAVNHESVSREYRTPFCHLISRQIRKSAVTFFSGHRRRFSFCCSQRAVDVLLESITKSPVREYTHRLKRRDLGQRCASVGNATGCFTFAWSIPRRALLRLRLLYVVADKSHYIRFSIQFSLFACPFTRRCGWRLQVVSF